jgi:hypothetical protein
VRITRWLVTAVAVALASTLALFAAAGAAAPLGSALAAVALLGVAFWALLRGGRAQQAGSLRVSLAWSYASYAAAVSLSALVAFPVIDRWQDLPALAQRIHADTRQEPLALLDPDETTIAMLDHGLRTPFTILSSDAADPAQVVGGWFTAHGATARVLVLLPGHAPGSVTRWLGSAAAPADDGVAGRLLATGAAALAQRYELPQGRRYALLAPPP